MFTRVISNMVLLRYRLQARKGLKNDFQLKSIKIHVYLFKDCFWVCPVLISCWSYNLFVSRGHPSYGLWQHNRLCFRLLSVCVYIRSRAEAFLPACHRFIVSYYLVFHLNHTVTSLDQVSSHNVNLSTASSGTDSNEERCQTCFVESS